MKINFSRISQIKASCERLKNIKMSIKTAYKLSKLSNLLDNEIAFYQEQYKKIIDLYAERDENGEYKFIDEAQQNIKIQSDKVKEASSAFEELQNLEVELPDIYFTLDEFEKIEITPEDISGIIDFIKEGE